MKITLFYYHCHSYNYIFMMFHCANLFECKHKILAWKAMRLLADETK